MKPLKRLGLKRMFGSIPRSSLETYCIVALEAQKSRLFYTHFRCRFYAYVNKGGVIINRQSVHLNQLIENETYWDMFAQHLDYYLSNRELMEPYREQGASMGQENDLETHIDQVGITLGIGC